MKLKYVSIKNYRSIKELRVDFNPQCRVLVGINESGKSNILSALNLLDTSAKSTKKDIREPLKGEKQATEAYVRFIFGFNADEATELYDSVKEKVLSEKPKENILNINGKDTSLKDFCANREILYVANILDSSKYFSGWVLSSAKIIKNWKKVSEACPAEFTIQNKSGDPVLLKTYKLVNTLEFKSIPTEYLEDAKAEDVDELVSGYAKKLAEDNILEVLFWNYDESKLLPPKINLQAFCDNPDTCIPLKRMFNLNGIYEIKKEVENAKQGSSNTLKNLLRRIAEESTKHFHKTWKEYDDIKFSLTIDGEDINATIEDKSNHYELSQRSDGFKRFITFLLLVSVRSKTNLLTDSLLLIDEPEIGLHPTGTRYLRDELIKISKENYVVFSTHSIFMIDNQVVRRHLIVQKNAEITGVTEVSDSNIQDEEVIFKSLGYSIFSNLKEKNLIFEGWRDKKLFEVAISSVPKTHTQIKVPLKKAGYCFAQGVKDISSITPLFEAGERKCLILSDNDTIAKEKQKDYQAAKGYGIWKRYSEIDSSISTTTGEDFVADSAFTTSIDDLRLKYTLSDTPNLADQKGKIYAFRQWLSKHSIAKEDIEKDIREMKDKVFENLKSLEIIPVYYQYLNGVVSHLEKLK